MKISIGKNLVVAMLFLASINGMAMERKQISSEEQKTKIYKEQKTKIYKWKKSLDAMMGEIDPKSTDKMDQIDSFLYAYCLCSALGEKLLDQNPNDVMLSDALKDLLKFRSFLGTAYTELLKADGQAIRAIIQLRTDAEKARIASMTQAEKDEEISSRAEDAKKRVESELAKFKQLTTEEKPKITQKRSSNVELNNLLDIMEAFAK